MQSEASAAFAPAADTTASVAARSTINIGDKISDYRELCTEYLGSISRIIGYIRSYRDNVFLVRATVNKLGPVLDKFMNDRHEIDVEFSAAVKEALSACSSALLDEGTSPEDLISFIEAQAEKLATLKTQLQLKAERVSLGITLATSALGSALAPSLVGSQRDRLTVLDTALNCVEAWEQTSEGGTTLVAELNELQRFEVASLAGAEAVQALMWWKEHFDRLSPVAEQLENIQQLFESDLGELMSRLDLEFTFGNQADMAEWVESLLAVLEKAIGSAQESVDALDTNAD